MYKLNKHEMLFFIKLANIMNESIGFKLNYKEYIYIKMNGEEIKSNQMSNEMDSIINGYVKHKELDLWWENLTIIPSDLSKLTKLECLYLKNNKLTSIPDLNKLTELGELNLGDNQLTSIPSDLSKLTELKELDLGYNQLTSVPDLSKLTELEWLNLNNNPINLNADEIREKFNVIEGCEIYV